MGKDTAEKRLTEYPDVAADVIDGVIFEGRPVVKAEDLYWFQAQDIQEMKRENFLQNIGMLFLRTE